MEERARGRRPVGGELPVCGKTAICKAQRVRTMGACRNCAVYSLRNAVAPKKSRLDDLLSQSTACKDLYTRLCANKSDQDAWLIDIYVHFAGGCVADVYTGKKVEPKHDDLVHAKQLFGAVGLTCLMFNNMSPSHATFRFIEDLLFCKRHKPVLTSWGLKKMCQAVCRACEPDPNNLQTMERIKDVKHTIIAQSAVMNCTDLSLKRQFNDWCTNFLKLDNQPTPTPRQTQSTPTQTAQSVVTSQETTLHDTHLLTPNPKDGLPQQGQAQKSPDQKSMQVGVDEQTTCRKGLVDNPIQSCLSDQPSFMQHQNAQTLSVLHQGPTEVNTDQVKQPNTKSPVGTPTKRPVCPTTFSSKRARHIKTFNTN